MKNTILFSLMLTAALNATDGATLFTKCASCHGVDGGKSALGKSKMINQMSVPEIEAALSGYQNGTYGGTMKALMKGQAASLSETDIKTIAEYIGAK